MPDTIRLRSWYVRPRGGRHWPGHRMWLPGKSGLDRAQSGFDHGCIARVGCPRNRTDTETEGGCSNSHRASEPAGNTCPRSPRATSACTPPHQAPTAAWLRENNDVAGVNLSTNGSYSVVIQACSHSPSRPAVAAHPIAPAGRLADGTRGGRTVGVVYSSARRVAGSPPGKKEKNAN